MLKWIKLDVYIMSDPKVEVIRSKPNGYMIFYVWIALITEAGKVNDGGKVYLDADLELTIDQISAMFHMPLDEIRYALDVLEDLKMIDWDGVILVTKWRAFQGSGVEEIKKKKDKLRKQVARAQGPVVDGPLDAMQTNYKTDANNKREYVGNIRLKDAEAVKLKDKYGHKLVGDYMSKVSDWKMAGDIVVKSDYLIILNWMKKSGVIGMDVAKSKTCVNGHSYTGPYCQHTRCGEK